MRVLTTQTYREWIGHLKDRSVRARIQVRVDRLVHGNPGQCRALTEGVTEMKLDLGPGYRVYFMRQGDDLLLLLAGGDKATQNNDIKKALELARQFKET